MATFSDAVRALSDDGLVALLRARPDLASPSPSTLRSLAARASSRTSLERALAHADTPTIQVLEAVLALEELGPVSADDVALAVGATDAAEVAAVHRLVRVACDRALLWRDRAEAQPPAEAQPGAAPTAPGSPAVGFRTAPGLIEVLGPYPAGLGPATGIGAVDLDDHPTLDVAGAREVLDALAWGPPAGTLPPARSAARAAVDALLSAGLLDASAGDGSTVVLPREVGLALRGGRTHRAPRLAPPEPASAAAGARPVPAAIVEAEAATAAVESVRLVDTLLRAWEDAPPPVLRTGGLGVRDLKRAAQALVHVERTAASVASSTTAAGLVDDDGEAPPSYVPTTRADTWDEAETADRWGMLALAWAGSRRTPWLAGTRDDKGGVRAPLSSDLSRGWVPRLRTQVMTALAAAHRPAGPAMSLDDVVADLAWRAPRAVPPTEAVDGLLREAALLGMTGAGVLAPTGGTVLALLDGVEQADGPDAEVLLARTLRAVLPASVDEVLLQGDLTGIVPGRPSRDLAVLIDRAAEVESRGAATTVRFTPASVTRALDAGLTGEELLDALAARSRTPVPQPLEYLVRDTARRHAAVRIGAVGSYVRAADPAVLTGLVEDERLAELGLVRLAPTVVASSAPAATLQAALRRRGLLAALEGPDGRPLGRLRRPPRIERGGARGLRSPYASAGAPTSDDGRRALVERLRVADGAGRRSPFTSTAGGEGGDPLATLHGTASRASPATSAQVMPGAQAMPGDTLALLRDAVRDGADVWVELVDGHGRPARRRVRPLRVDGGRLRAVDTSRGAELTVAVHRIAAVEPAD